MTEVNIYKEAARLNLTFPYKGQSSVADLWKVSQKELNDLYGKLKEIEQTSKKASLMEVKSAEDKELDLQIAIVEDIYGEKEKEKKEKAMKNQQLQEDLMRERMLEEALLVKKGEELSAKTTIEIEEELAKIKKRRQNQ